jgi:hypothetical protein
LDDAIYIQDSRYYQAFSYVLKIDEQLESYKSIVKTLIHPTGMALFGEYDIRNEFDLSAGIESMLNYSVLTSEDQVLMSQTAFSMDFGKSLEDSTIPADDISFFFNKPLEDFFNQTDSVSVLSGKGLNDSFDQTDLIRFSSAKTLNDSVIINETINLSRQTAKYINDTITSIDNSGDLWKNPYNNPYPVGSSYFSNDGGDYVGEKSSIAG